VVVAGPAADRRAVDFLATTVALLALYPLSRWKRFSEDPDHVEDRRRCGLGGSGLQGGGVGGGRGVAVREFPMAKGHGVADYLLFVDGKPVGVVEAKKTGTPLVGVEWRKVDEVVGV
jgi:hypothetical protein